MKITQLNVDNVKRLLAVQITPGPDGSMIVIGGDNAQGKTSLLDSIAMAIGGGDEIPDQPIRQGASKAQIVLKTEEFTVTRTFSKSGSSLTIQNADGAKIASPQALLDALTNRVSFDPLAFTRMPADKQADNLRKLVGVDFSKLDAEYAGKYQERTGVNRDVKSQQVRVDGMQRHPGAPKEPVKSEDVLNRLELAQNENQSNEEKRRAVQTSIAALQGLEMARANAQEAFEEAKRKLQAAEEAWTAAVEQRDKTAAEAEALVDVETDPIMAELRELEAINKKVTENAQWQKENEKLVTLSKKANDLTARLVAIDEEKETALAKAEFPVPGLAFSTDGITFQGVPFDQASAAEQLRVSVAMGFALQPKLKIALIRDGSLLDDKSLALVAEIAESNQGQVWIERVGKGQECSVIIEAGQVLEDRTEAQQAQKAKKPAK